MEHESSADNDQSVPAACLERLARSLSRYGDLDMIIRPANPAPCLAIRNTAIPGMSETVTVGQCGDGLVFEWSWRKRLGDVSDPDSAAYAIAYVLEASSTKDGQATSELGMGMPGSLPPEVQGRSRVLVAERLGWPENAPVVCEDIGKRCPGYYAWWTPSPYPDPGFRPAWGAALVEQPVGHLTPNIYARTPAELIQLIADDTANRQEAAGQRHE